MEKNFGRSMRWRGTEKRQALFWSRRSGKDIVQDFAVDVGQTHVATTEAIGQALMVNA